MDGKPVRLKSSTSKKRKKRTGKVRYGPEVIAVVRRIWEEYDYRCGKLLAPQIRLMIDFLERDELFGPLITADIKAKLLTISPRTRFRGGDHRPQTKGGPEKNAPSQAGA